MLTAAIYIRKSREDADKEAHRLNLQREQLPAYAISRGWRPVIYDDGYASASRENLANLKERARLESDIRANRINIVLVLEFSRISRDDSMEDYARFIGLCKDHGVKLATPSQTIDPRQTNEWLLAQITGSLSAAEMQQLKTRMAEGRAEARRKGKFNGGVCPPPYRYDKARERPVIDPDSLDTMQRIWAMAETHSARLISETLGLPHISVRRALADDRLMFCQALRIDSETGDTITCDWEPCLNADQSARIKAARQIRSNHKKGKKTYSSLLTGLELIYCGYCGKTIKTWHNSRVKLDGTRINYYGCQDQTCKKSRLIPQPAIDQGITINILNSLSKMDDLIKAWEATHRGENPGAELARIDAGIKAAETKKHRLVTAITEGIVTLADARPTMHEITATLAELTLVKTQITSRAENPPDWESLTITADDCNRMDLDQKRQFLRITLKRIDIYSAYAVLHYRFPRKPGEYTAKINLPPPQPGRYHK
jgi:site-specific DNA recombinase